MSFSTAHMEMAKCLQVDVVGAPSTGKSTLIRALCPLGVGIGENIISPLISPIHRHHPRYRDRLDSSLICRFVKLRVDVVAAFYEHQTAPIDECASVLKDRHGSEREMLQNCLIEVVLVVFDLTDRHSFYDATQRVAPLLRIRSTESRRRRLILVGSMLEMDDARAVDKKDAVLFAEQNDFESYIEVSSILYSGIDDLKRVLINISEQQYNTVPIEKLLRSFILPESQASCDPLQTNSQDEHYIAGGFLSSEQHKVEIGLLQVERSNWIRSQEEKLAKMLADHTSPWINILFEHNNTLESKFSLENPATGTKIGIPTNQEINGEKIVKPKSLITSTRSRGTSLFSFGTDMDDLSQLRTPLQTTTNQGNIQSQYVKGVDHYVRRQGIYIPVVRAELFDSAGASEDDEVVDGHSNCIKVCTTSHPDRKPDCHFIVDLDDGRRADVECYNGDDAYYLASLTCAELRIDVASYRDVIAARMIDAVAEFCNRVKSHRECYQAKELERRKLFEEIIPCGKLGTSKYSRFQPLYQFKKQAKKFDDSSGELVINNEDTNEVVEPKYIPKTKLPVNDATKTKSSDNAEMFSMEIEIEKGNFQIVRVCEGDRIDEVARKFSQVHGLDEAKELVLKRLIDTNMSLHMQSIS